MFLRILTVVMFVLGSAIGLTVNAYAGDPFTVGGVHVDATAEDALIAQTEAIAQGQVTAANILIKRMSLASERRAKGFAGVSAEDGPKMIRALEITNEKRSANRYLGDISVAFNRAAVEQYMRAKGLRIIATQSRKRLVIPAVQGQDLWEPSPWSYAWRRANIDHALTPMQTITPSVDVLRVIRNPNTRALNMQKLQAVGRVYGLQQILIVNATREGTGYSATIQDIAVDTETSRYLGRVRGLTAAETMRKVVRKVENDWKASAVTAVNAETVILPVSILYRSHAEWVGLKDVINGSAQIRSAQLEAVSKSGALMSLYYGGDIDRLRNELAFKGVSLREDEELGMVLTRTSYR